MKTKALTFLLLITFCLNSKQTDAAIAHDTVFYNCVGNANLTTNGINDNYSWFMPMQGGQFIRLNITNYNIADGAILNVYSGTNVFDTLIASYNNTSGSSFQVDIYNSVYIILRSYSGLSSTVNFNMHCSSYYGNYCVSNLNPDCTNEDYISNVSISNTTLNNSSSCIADYSSYSDYLQEGNKTAKLVKGSTYGLNVTSTKNSIISCWIDYNENYIFESSEWTQISISSAPNMPSSMNITIPVTAAAGQKRMRIRSRTIGNVNGPNDACTQFGSGETEDYIVSIVNSSSFLIANFSSTQSSINTDGTINFFDKSNNSPTTWNWTFVGGTPSSSTQQNPTNIKYQTAGIYPVTLTVTNANSSDTYTSFKYVSVIGTANCNIGLNPNCNSLQEIKRVKIYGTDLHYAALCTNGNASYASINPTDSGTCVLTKGVSYKLGVTTSSSSKISCWIDYNQNNIFEHSEYTAIALSSTPNIESNKFITIPREFVASGFFKMRIRSSASASLNDAGNACTSLGNGDTEDYLIVIAESNFSYTTDLVRNGTFNPYINGVLLNNLNNQNTGAAGGPNYFDYTSLSADLNAGQYLLEISSFVPNIGEKVAFFIDFNNNNNFDYPSEKIWESSQLTDPSNLSSYNITVPSTIQTTRLRIVSVYEPSYPGASVGANLGPTEGEIEDYTLNFNGGIPKPLVNFSANNLNITVGTHINFTDLSSNNPTQWQWFFEGAETSSSILQNPINIRYNTPGCYKVVLVASNSAGSNVKVQNCYINVSVPSQLPLANFTSNNTDIVMENTVNFLDQSLQNPTSWQWTFEGGIPSTSNLQNPTNILYDIPGCFKVTLVVSNAFGTDTIIRSCYVQVVNNEYCIPENTGIPPSYASFINGVTLNGFSNLNSGITLPNCYYNNSAVSTILNVNNTYSITLNRGGNCNHYAVWIDYNNDGDFIDPGEKVAFAQGVTTSTITRNFTVPSTIVSGNYRLRIRATYQVFIFLEMDPCENYIVGETEDYNIQIIGVPLPPPVANFTANTFSIEVGQSINFTDLSTNTPTSWSWTFAGASPASSNAQNPSNITYNTAGCYQVSLTATNSAGNNTYTQTCYINVTNVNPYCIPLPVNGTNFGDYINSVTIGTISNINSGAVAGPSYSNYSNLSTNLSTNTAYNIVVQNGTYTNDSIAAWIDYNDDGDFADAGEKLDQVSAPIINANYTLNFTVPGSVPLGSKRLRVRIAYLPASAPNMDPCTNYNYGETEDYSVNIVAGTVITPVANFTANTFTISAGQSVNFTDLSTNNPTSWNWTFTGASPASSTSQNPSNITYNTPGCYQVSLTATNSAGSNTSSQTCYITVTNAVITPVANFSSNSQSITTGQSVNFTDLSTNNPTSWNWTFTGGSPASSTSQNPSNITYNTPGCFQVSLTATNSAGNNTKTMNCYITVNSVVIAPVANFTANNFTINTGQSVNFTDLSTNVPTSWNWTFTGASPSSSTSQNPTNITYNTAGCYQVSLTATNSAGNNTSTQTCYINVTNPVITPVANFSASSVNIITGQSVNFTDLSTNNPTSWNWVFVGAAPASSNSQNPTNIVYNTAGCYQVSLTATNSAGSNTSTQVCYITVLNPIITPIANFTANTQYITVGQLVNFTDISTNNPTSWNWVFTGAVPTSSSLQNPTNITYNTAGCYQVALTATNSAGSNTSTQLCYINVVPAGIQPQASFSINPNPACTNSVDNLLNTSTNALTFNWDMLGASPANSTDQFPVISYDVPGTYTIILTAVNGANTDTVSQSITVYPTPTINAGTDVGICLGSSVTLNAVAAGNYSYNWTPAATLTTPTLSQTLATPNTNTDYVITINDAFCSASDTIAVIVWPLPIAPIITQVGNTLEATTGFPAYQWYENNVIIPGETQSTITPINNGSYTVDAIDTNGCISTSLAFAFVIQGVNTVSNNQISIYPNPTSNILYINLHGNIQKTRLEIIDAKGKLVLDDEINANASFVSTEQLSTGMYFIRFINANQVIQHKFIKN